MRKIAAILAMCSLSLQPLAVAQQGASTSTTASSKFSGYSAEDTQAERGWEEKFRAIPDPKLLREYMQLLSARPHHVGSPYDKQNAEWILSKFKEWGWNARIETFDVLFPTPKERLLEMTGPTKYTAKLEEPTLAVDPTSGQKAEQLPTYNAYSPDGDVTGRLVYVNYGLPADYEQLDRLGVSVKGAIVIARYGNSWRGIKPKSAAEHGAIACLIYSDPADDGYNGGDVYPQGPMRPPQGVQRGSVMDMPLYPGDPLTPGVGATKEAKRLPISEAKSLAKIPTLPISYGDAQPLLAALKGPLVPEEWRGGLPITYHAGPGPATVHLRLKFNWDTKPVYDVVARMEGSSQPEQWIVRGNHHDGWVNGAEDPISGQIALLEEARALGQLAKQGWKPKRTIIYCAWDGEEPMLLGSTEWAETHAEELMQHAAMYINTDGNGRGYLQVEGSHSLEHFVNEVAHDVQDPEANVSVWQRGKARKLITAKSNEARQKIRNRSDLRIGPLGSGSDYTVFIDHLGIATLNVGFGGEDDGGIYHSIYDDFYWYTHFSDVDFVYGRALSQTVGTQVMRFADADLLPYDFTGLADTIKTYQSEVQELLKQRKEFAEEQNRELKDGVFAQVNDPRKPTVPPPTEVVPQQLNFAPLENATETLARAADDYKAAADAVDLSHAASLNELNQQLAQSERKLLDNAGLFRRPWYRHLLYAPGWYTGYGSKTLPGIREAIEEKRYDQADQEIARAAKVVQDEAAFVQSLAEQLKKMK